MSITTEQTAKIVKDFGGNAKNSGSTEAQVAILTHRINSLTEHMKENHKDNHSRRGLLRMVSLRKRLLAYVRGKDEERYQTLIKKLGLRK